MIKIKKTSDISSFEYMLFASDVKLPIDIEAPDNIEVEVDIVRPSPLFYGFVFKIKVRSKDDKN